MPTPRMKISNDASNKLATKERPPMDRMRAAYQCDRILSQLPPEERALVVEFIRNPRQVSLPGVGNP
jgi:hypothetical protein